MIEESIIDITLPVGTPVTVENSVYPGHQGATDLVVLKKHSIGMHIGHKGGNPAASHDMANGWMYYSYTGRDGIVTAKKESKEVTKFNVGDKVRYIKTEFNNPEWVGVEGTVEDGGFLTSVRITKSTKGSRDDGYVVGKLADLQSDSLELMPEYPDYPAYPAYKVGDRVTVKGYDVPGSLWEGRTGTIVDTYFEGANSARVEFPNDHPTFNTGTFHYGELVPAEPEVKAFTYADIQKGDTIKRTKRQKGGAVETREGVAEVKGEYYWATADGRYLLSYDNDTQKDGVTLELVHRPEPEPKITDGTKPGDRIVARFETGVTKVYTKQEDGQWDTLVIGESGRAHKGFKWSDSTLASTVDRTDVKTTRIMA